MYMIDFENEIDSWPHVNENSTLKVAIEACLNAGKHLFDGYYKNYQTTLNSDKSDHTPYDIQSEKIIESVLRSHKDNDAIVSEELYPDCSHLPKTFWTIDGIDGTTNYSRQIPICNVTLSKVENGELYYGVVYDFIHDELFYAMKDHGAYLNGKRIKTVNRNFSESVISIYPMRYVSTRKNAEIEKSHVQTMWRTMREIVEITGRFPREIQSGALELAWIAAGRLDAFCAAWTNPWDLSAGILLVKESGGVATSLCGDSWQPSQEGLIVGSKSVHHEILVIYNKLFVENI